MVISHGSYNLEKVLNFSSHLEKYLIPLLGLEKSLKFTTLSTPEYASHPFSVKLDYFVEENLAHPRCKRL